MTRVRVRQGFRLRREGHKEILKAGDEFDATDEELKKYAARIESADSPPPPQLPDPKDKPLPRRARGRPRKVRFATPPETTAMG